MKAKKIYKAFEIYKNAFIKVAQSNTYKKYRNEINELIEYFDKILILYKTIQTTATPADLDGDDRLNFIVVSENQTLKEYLKERRQNEKDPAKKRDFYVYYEFTYEYCIKTREVNILSEKYLKIYE